MNRILFLALSSLLFASSAFATGSTQPFFDLVEIKRDADGNVYEIMIRKNLPERPLYIVQDEILASVKEQQSLGALQNIIPFSEEKYPGEREVDEYRKIVQKIIEKLQSIDMEEALKNADLRKILDEFQKRLIESTRDFQVIARPTESDYFHKNKVMKELLKMGIEEAMKHLPGTIAGVASYIMSETVRMLIERRTYYQNFVAHYLLTHTPEELGLTVQDVAWIKSSIHESKIAWDKPWDSWDASEQWDTFGTVKYNNLALVGQSNWDREGGQYDAHGDFYGISFVPVLEDGVEKIKNIIDKKSRYSNSLSEALDYSRPCKQIGFRFITRLIEFGITQVPVPNVVKKPFSKYVRSLYAAQSVREGFLTGYMMSHNMPEVKYILLQGFNPLVIMDHQWDANGNNRYRNLSCQ